MPSSFPSHYFCSLHRSIAKAANDGNDDLWTSSLQDSRRKTTEKTHDTNRTEIRLHGRSKFYRFSFKGIQVVFVKLFLKGTVYCDKWNKSKEFRTDPFFFVRNVFHLLLRNNLRFFRFNEASNVSCKARYLSKIVVCIWRLFLLFISLCAQRLRKELLSGFRVMILQSGLHTFVIIINRPRTRAFHLKIWSFSKALVFKLHSPWRSACVELRLWRFCWFCSFQMMTRCLQVNFECFNF